MFSRLTSPRPYIRSPSTSGNRTLYPFPSSFASMARSAFDTAELNRIAPVAASTSTAPAAVLTDVAVFSHFTAGQSRFSIP